MQRVSSGGIQAENAVTGTTSNTAQSLADLGATIAKAADASGVVHRACFAIISIENNDLRMSFDTPTAAKGILWAAGETWKLESEAEVQKFSAISAIVGAHASVQIIIQY